jgi:hypothetical protein
MIFGAALLLGLALPASAQSVSAGMGGVWINDSNAVHLNFGGDVPIKSSRTLETQAVGELGVQFFDSTTTWLGGGVRFVGKKSAKVRPFGQVLIGGFFCCDDSAFGLQFGGGVDLPMKSFTVRIQGDIPTAFDDGDSRTGFKLTGGIVFPFKK